MPSGEPSVDAVLTKANYYLRAIEPIWSKLKRGQKLSSEEKLAWIRWNASFTTKHIEPIKPK